MVLKRFEAFLKITTKGLGIAYLIGLMSFLGTELHAREYREARGGEHGVPLHAFEDDGAIKVPRPSSRANLQLERWKTLDALFTSELKHQIADLRGEVGRLRRQVEDARFGAARESVRGSRHRSDEDARLDGDEEAALRVSADGYDVDQD